MEPATTRIIPRRRFLEEAVWPVCGVYVVCGAVRGVCVGEGF